MTKSKFLKGDSALAYVSTQIWDFSSISHIFKILSPKLFGNSYTKFAILVITFPFSCGESDLYWNIVKFQIVMTRIVRKFSLCSSHFQCWFKFLEKVLIWLKNVTSFKELPINKVESFLKSKCWPQLNMQSSASTKPLNLEL